MISAMTNISEDIWTHWTYLFGWVYDGVDYNIAGNGGKDCSNFLSFYQKIIESIVAVIYGGILINWAYKYIRLPERTPRCNQTPAMKQVLLVVLCLTFGVELGFKFATRQMIWLCNPCHITTMMQIYVLAAPPNRWVTAVFRIHIYFLAGATIAIVFPVVNTRMLLFETGVYYVQHYLILIIPWYLITLGGVYTMEPLHDMTWLALSLGGILVYHFTLLQYVAMMTWINLNNMICPAISDPFYGPYYRVIAVSHMSLIIPIHGKLYMWLGRKLSSPQILNENANSTDSTSLSNGHYKQQ